MAGDAEGAPADALAEKARFDARMKGYEQSYLKTENPLYVWMAIKDVSTSHVGILSKIHENFPFPEWCLKYLYFTSHRLLSLGRLGDISPVDENAPPGPQSTISATRAADLMAKALGMTAAAGKSSFLEFSKDAECVDNLLRLESMQQWLGSPREAIDYMMDVTGLKDVRSLQRRLAKAKKSGLRPSNDT